MYEKTVSDSTQDKALKPKKKEKPIRADEPLHADKTKPEKTTFINKYGFLHVDKKLAEHLSTSFGKDKEYVPVSIEPIERWFVVKLKA